MKNNTKLEIYDTTLRDGAQSEGINYSVSDKIKIVKKLDDLGMDFIEAGWPGANPVDNEIFKEIKKLNLKRAKITAFGSTRKVGVKEKDDVVLNLLLEANTEIITIFGKSWDFQVEHALNTTLEENLKMVSGSIKYLREKGREVFFDAEHFFDGYKNNSEYAMEVVRAAKNAGATRIILCDTNGGCTHGEIYKITHAVKEDLGDMIIGIHCHNDSDLAVANSIAAVDAGATQIQGTINGYGERCGNANLCSIIPNLQIKRGYKVLGSNIKKLTEIARQIAEISNISLKSNAPFVGRSAFAHKAGIHASGVRKNSQTYEHITPESVGNIRRFLISDQAGTASIKEKLENLKFVSEIKPNEIKEIIDKIKHLEWEGFAFEGADASFEILVMKTLKKLPKFFDVFGFRVIGDTTKATSTTITEASVKIQIKDEIVHTVAEGDGPVNALDVALKKALAQNYPQILNIKLNDFKVRILDSKQGTAAKVRVSIESTDGTNKWDTVGVSTNIIEASYGAIVDSIVYGLLLARKNK